MKCEKHKNVKAPCCEICLIEERDRLKSLLERAIPEIYLESHGNKELVEAIKKELNIQ